MRHDRRALTLFAVFALLCFVVVVPTAMYAADALAGSENYGEPPALRQARKHPPLFFEDEVNTPVRQLSLNLKSDGVCLVCAEGRVLFRASNASRNSSNKAHTFMPGVVAAMQDFDVCSESMEDAKAIRHAAGESHRSLGALLDSPHDCVARLYNLGLLQPPRATTTRRLEDGCVRIRTAVLVLEPNASAAALASQCGANVAQLRQTEAPKTRGVFKINQGTTASVIELSTPRFIVWPVQSSQPLSPNISKTAISLVVQNSSSTPAYFRTAPVAETEVDADVSPPSSITLAESRDAIVVQFDSMNNNPPTMPAASAAAVGTPPDLHCPLRFLTVRLGSFGRHHNQLQEVLHGIALAAELNRTFLLPPFVPVLYADYLKVDTEVLYGWHALREKGRYCIFTYNEARPLLREAFAHHDGATRQQRKLMEADASAPAAGTTSSTATSAHALRSMTLARVHLDLDPAALARARGQSAQLQEQRAWGELPRVPQGAGQQGGNWSEAVFYDMDAWFACGVHVAFDATVVQVARSGGSGTASRLTEAPLLLQETFSPTVYTEPPTKSKRHKATCWEEYQTEVNSLFCRFGVFKNNCSVSGKTGDGSHHVLPSPQPDLVVLSSATAFQLRPRLPTMTRLLGLLRPSPSITSEVGRFYRLWATQFRWPVYTNSQRSFTDCLQPRRFRDVVGFHVRRREMTCRQEAEDLTRTVLALTHGHYVLEGTGQRVATNDGAGQVVVRNSSVGRLVNDCMWDAPALVRLFRQYSQWVTAERNGTTGGRGKGGTRSNTAAAARHGAIPRTPPRFTTFIAHDEQSGPIAANVEVILQRNYTPTRDEILADGQRPSFAAVYDRRLRKDFHKVYDRTVELVKKAAAAKVAQTNAPVVVPTRTWKLNELLSVLYPLAEQELLGMGFDFFMLSNTGVFRGNALSSVSTNVCLRRWGRGLPCHGVMPGYFEALYKGFF